MLIHSLQDSSSYHCRVFRVYRLLENYLGFLCSRSEHIGFQMHVECMAHNEIETTPRCLEGVRKKMVSTSCVKWLGKGIQDNSLCGNVD